MYVYLILNRYGAFNNEKRNVESISMQYELFIITKLIWNTLCIWLYFVQMRVGGREKREQTED